MRHNYFKILMIGLCTLNLTLYAAAKNPENESSNTSVKKVLIIGLNNFSSNYYPKSMIAEETGIPADSICYTYNNIIANNIIKLNKDKNYLFEKPSNTQKLCEDFNALTLKGENEECFIDLKEMDDKKYNNIISAENADYVLILNQHYLRWQEKPLRTLFHFVSYSLYDKNKDEITKGNNYFTCMELEETDKLYKSSKKSSSKIASNVIKSLNANQF